MAAIGNLSYTSNSLIAIIASYLRDLSSYVLPLCQAFSQDLMTLNPNRNYNPCSAILSVLLHMPCLLSTSVGFYDLHSLVPVGRSGLFFRSLTSQVGCRTNSQVVNASGNSDSFFAANVSNYFIE